MESWLGQLGPMLLVVGLACVVLPFADPSNRWIRAGGALLCVVLLARYMIWRATDTIPEIREWDVAEILQAALSWLYFAIELVGAISGVLLFHVLSRTIDRKAEVEAHPIEELPGGPPLIDMFIATYNESRDILHRTIVGALAQDYPRFRVWVLDDGRRPEIRELAEVLGAGYLTRPDNFHSKAGNMNAGWKYVMSLPEPPDAIGVLDADFVAFPMFLRRAAALLHDPQVGVVQTPQHFFNPDPIQLNLAATHVVPDEQRFFFDVLLASKDAHGTAFCCGTSSLARVSALEKIGGFPIESVTEDLLISIKLKEIGMKTVYLNERLSIGLAPEGLGEYLTQRGRWCLGTMQIVRTPWGPFSRSRMPLKMRLHTVDSVLYWLFGPITKLAGIMVPILYWWTGLFVMNTDLGPIVSHLGPYWMACVIFIAFVSRGTNVPIFAEAMALLISLECIKASLIGLFGSKNQKFKVTAKGASRTKVVVQWGVMRNFLILIGLSLGGAAYRLVLGPHDGTPPDVEIANFFWTIYNSTMLLVACLMCIELPRFRSEERFPLDEASVLVTNGVRQDVRLTDISIGGARMRFSGAVALRPGQQVALEVPGAGLVTAEITRAGADICTVRFADDLPSRTALIRTVFSGKFGTQISALRPGSLVMVLLRRAWG